MATVLFAGFAIGTVGCAGEPADAPAPGTPPDTVLGDLVSVIGELDGPREYLFGDVSSVSIGPGDIVYIADQLGATVRAYDLEGEFLTTIGAEGDGPGEFQFPNDIAFDPVGRMYVRDRYRVTVFGPHAEGQVRDSVIRTFPLERPTLETARARATGERYYSPSYYYFMFVRHRFLYEVMDSMGTTGDTILVPALPNPEILGRANYLVPSGDYGQPVDGVNMAPFEPRPSWDITSGGSVITTLGARYEVVEWGPAGDTVRVIRVETVPRAVPPAALRDSTRAFRTRLDSIPVPLSEVNGMSETARSGRLPETLPDILALHVAPDGTIWVRRWPSIDQTGETVFDVLEASGRPLRTVRLPVELAADLPPFVSETLVAGVVRDRSSMVERVALFSLPEVGP